MKMIFINPKKFIMGSDTNEDELPKRKITLSPYYIDEKPVSNKEYKKFIDDGGYTTKKYWCDEGWNFIKNNNISYPCYWNDENWNKDDFPVTGVS